MKSIHFIKFLVSGRIRYYIININELETFNFFQMLLMIVLKYKFTEYLHNLI
jgi:hypothetical protein